MVITAYLPALKSGFIWDDDQHVTGNQAVMSAGGLREIWLQPESSPQYYPLAHTVFWLEYHCFGVRPLGYHLINILLHALNAVLVFFLLKRLSLPGAWLVAAVFALHPVHVESVAWVSELKNVLSGFFYLSALLAYFRFDDPENGGGQRRFSQYALSLFLFFCALLSKTVTASLPVAILLILWWKRPKLASKDVLPLLPMLLAGAGMGLVTIWMEKHHVQAVGDDWSLSFIGRLLVAGRAIWFYLAKLAWPCNLTFIYSKWNVDTARPGLYLFPLAFFLLSASLYYLQKRIGRGPLAGVAFFAVSLVPALGFFDVYPFRYSYVADHFQYLASLGVLTIIIGAGVSWFRGHQSYHRTVGLPAAVLLLAALWTLTFRQTRIYHNSETLWQDTIAKNPSCWMAYNNLGIYYLQKGNQDQAEVCFQKAVLIDPGKVDQRSSLGLLHLSKGSLPEALDDFKKATILAPDDSRTHYNLGQTYIQMDSLPQAEAELKKAISINNNYAKAHCNLGIVYHKQKKYSLAEQELKLARALNPSLYQADYYLALIFWGRCKRAEAEAGFLWVLKIQPDFPEAEYDLGRLYLEMGRPREAEAIFRGLQQRHPGFIEIE